MSPHDLLIRHARAWAEQRKRPLDAELLETALELRFLHDDLPATAWPAGSVTDLMLRRWPSHGPELDDPEALADSLDTFVRFLRATGRMASGSDEPRALAKEAHRAAPRMAEALADVASHGSTKTLLGFGKEIGIDIDQLDSPQQLQAALNQIMTAWNALPEDERRARMPLSQLGVTVPEDGGEVSPHVYAGEPASIARAAEQARQSPFVQACLRLVDWVGERREVTGTGVLRLAEARKAWTELELWRWFERDLALLPPWLLGGAVTVGPDHFPWRRAGDVLALERLWQPAHDGNLLDVGATVARALPEHLPQTDNEWVDLAIDLVFGLYGVAEAGTAGLPSAAPFVLLLAELAAEETLSREQLAAYWEEYPDNYYRAGAVLSEELQERAAGWSKATLERSLHFFQDAGVWEERDGVYRLTDLGKVFYFIYRDELPLDLDDPDD